MTFTSHSAIECYRTCPRKRYLNYHHLGTGIVPSSKSIPLTTGNEVHTGIGYILEKYKSGAMISESLIDKAVEEALDSYARYVGTVYQENLSSTDIVNNFTYDEQRTLIEGLIRSWVLVELPNIMEGYKVLEVEKEIAFPLTNDIILGSKADAILQQKETGEILVYSLKTMKKWDKRTNRSYKKGSQVVTETEAVRWYLEERSKDATERIDFILSHSKKPFPADSDIVRYYEQFTSYPTSVGVKFCFLIKGDRRTFKEVNGETMEEENSWASYSPLIYGYKKYTPNGVEYAYVNKTIKPENKSGYGRLGKGWEEFNVWEEEALGESNERVRNWINLLNSGKIQPELMEYEGHVLKQQIVTPVEVYPSRERVEETINDIKNQEPALFYFVSPVSYLDPITCFPKHDRSCHWPINCEYLPICWNEQPYADLPVDISLESVLESGMYEKRKSHYKLEEKIKENIRKNCFL